MTTSNTQSPTPAERRKFARTLAIGMPITALLWLLILYWLRGEWMINIALYIFIIGESLAGITFISARAGKVTYKFWYGLIWLIERIITFTLLTILYYLIITPIALVQRCAGRRGILKRGDPEIQSYWQASEKIDDLKRYYRQF